MSTNSLFQRKAESKKTEGKDIKDVFISLSSLQNVTVLLVLTFTGICDGTVIGYVYWHLDTIGKNVFSHLGNPPVFIFPPLKLLKNLHCRLSLKILKDSWYLIGWKCGHITIKKESKETWVDHVKGVTLLSFYTVICETRFHRFSKVTTRRIILGYLYHSTHSYACTRKYTT